ncbi:EmrB/QacA subfamily drug resistance transporter [Azospirillum lipoferum]|uniref:MFS transporter n=1 Tax=Azospirillum lipoferum TaxID=193 RepID=A0A5A9GSE3_AZOLI|nr:MULTISPECIES: MDR family MFS transporter [Azospirillum]KAA0597273.1 MFS transporter [Azospirillum lipoferum]MCP1608793.1 EmrB/QacA subfamily drug resistance transporter [Azospirillum lipoferum]MDW5535892.1 MDR family MFS transporter [Azospirillum sp. NL1]
MTETAVHSTRPNPAHPVFTHQEILRVFSGVALAMLMAAMDQTIVATALPTMASQFGGLEMLPWVVTAYLLTSTTTTPIYGKLSDLYGRKRVLQTAILLFLAGSVLCAAAQSMTQLILFRGLQGLGGGGLMSLAFTIIGDVVAPRERGRYQGMIGGVFALASVAGPLLGGIFTETIGWHWIFLINLPLGIAAFAMTRRTLSRLPAGRARPRIDLAGAALLTGAVTSLLIVATRGEAMGWGSPAALGLLAAGLVMLVVFLWHERRIEEPILPLHLFRRPVVAVATPVVAVSAMVLFAGIVYLPLHLQLVQGASATVSGLLLLPLVLGMTFGSVGGGRLIAKTGRYKAFPLAGLALSGLMYALLGTLPALTADGLWSTLILVPLGMGLGLVMPVMTVAVQNAVEQRDLGAATASVGFFRSLGGSVGVAVFGAVFNGVVSDRLEGAGLSGRAVLEHGAAALANLPAAARGGVVATLEHGFATLFLLAAALAVVSFAMTLFLKELPLRSANPGRPEAAPAAEG